MRISIVDKGFIVHVIQSLLCLEKELKSKPSNREEIVRPATPNRFHNRRRQVQLGTPALQRAVDLLSGGGGGGDGEEALVTFVLRLG